MGKNGPILEEDEYESEDEDKPKKKRNNKNKKRKKKINNNKNQRNNKKQIIRNTKPIKEILDILSDDESKKEDSNLIKIRNMSTPIKNNTFDKSVDNFDIIQSKILIGDTNNNIKTPPKEKKNSNDIFQTVPNNKYKGLFKDFMF